VVLAAGSLGSTELLLRCRDQHATLRGLSDRLGHGWSSNGDFLTPAFYPARRLSPTRGPTITCAIDFLDGARDGARFFVEDGGFPDVVGNSVADLAATAAHIGGAYRVVFEALRLAASDSDPLDCVMPWFGQAADAADGRLHLGRSVLHPLDGHRLALDWDVTASEAAVQGLVDAHRELSTATGGSPMVPVTWSWMKDLITPHPLGGCAMADGPHGGVVGADGQVFGHPGLYVADGSVIPRALGLNPSRTITALAEHIAAGMLAG
jgi:cholesterol oxidase